MKRRTSTALAVRSFAATAATLAGAAALLATALAVAPAAAEVIRVPVGQQAAEKRVLEVPQRGTTMTQVERRFGAPLARQPAVGKPPISSWEYENYRVYFEGDRVLHSVLKGTAVPASDQTAPATAE